MAIQVIPFRRAIPDYHFSTTLENVVYGFDVLWNDRDGSWSFSVSEQDGTPIASGIKIVTGVFLGRRYQHKLFRQGVIVAVDTSRKGLDAGFDDIGRRVVVLYVPVVDQLYQMDVAARKAAAKAAP